MIKLITISRRNNEMTMTKVTCPQRMTIVQPLGISQEGRCYRSGTKGHLSNTCTKNVAIGQWYMDKMKTQDAQLMQASGDTTSTINDWSSVTGTTPTTNGTNSQGTASQEANRPSWQDLQVPKSGTIHTHR